MLHFLAKSVTKWLLKAGAISHNDVALYEYAVYTFFFSMLPLTVSLCLGALLHMFFEALLMILPFVLIRKFSGGFHLKSSRVCFFVSSLFLALSIEFIKLVLTHKSFLFCSILAVISTFIIIVLSPIDSDERKLSLAEQKLFKKVSILLSLFFLGIYFILLMLKIWNCAASVGVGIVIPALLQIPCLFRRNKKPTS